MKKKSLPEKLKAWREREGYSCAAAAAYLGTSPRTIEAWEQDLRAPQGMARHFLERLIDDAPGPVAAPPSAKKPKR